ncbi:putative ribonuclease H-like domain-containing protein, partial [Tanacetum coccineum]
MLIECQIVNNCKKGLDYENYKAVPPPYTGNFMPPTPDMSFTGLDDFVNEPVVKNCKAMFSEEEPKVDCNYHQKHFQNQRIVKPVWNNSQRVNHQNFAKKTHPCAKKNMVPRAVLMKSGLVSINTARQNISKTAVSVNTAHSKTTVNAARPMSHLSKMAHSTGNPQMNLQDQGVIDSECSRHMTRNMSYLTNYEEIDRGYVAFGGNPKRGKITGKDDHRCLVQVYMDDIIFGSTKKDLCNAFEKLMHEKFQMGSMGELTFFLGLQVQQKKDDIFISQDKHDVKILKKCGFTEVKTASTPMETQKPLFKDEDGEEVDVHMYRSMIGSLMYLTSS